MPKSRNQSQRPSLADAAALKHSHRRKRLPSLTDVVAPRKKKSRMVEEAVVLVVEDVALVEVVVEEIVTF